MLQVLFALCLAALAGTSHAADAWPAKPVRLVIPFAAGSATDSAGRCLAQAVDRTLGQRVIVENSAGANGQIAAIAVAGARRTAIRCS